MPRLVCLCPLPQFPRPLAPFDAPDSAEIRIFLVVFRHFRLCATIEITGDVRTFIMHSPHFVDSGVNAVLGRPDFEDATIRPHSEIDTAPSFFWESWVRPSPHLTSLGRRAQG